MCSADLHVGDASIVVHGEIVLLAGCIAIHRRIVGAVDIRCKNILRKVIVCRAYIGIIEHVEHAKKGRRIVVAMIVLIVDQMNVRIRCQIGKLFLQISDDEVYIRNSRRTKLCDLTLDQHLTADAQKPLRRMVCDGRKTTAVARRHQHRICHAIGGKAFRCLCPLHGILRIKRCDCRIKYIFGHIVSHASIRWIFRMRIQ